MAEAILNHFGENRFMPFSAGSAPMGELNPVAVNALKARGIHTTGYRSKSWNEFSLQPIDIVIFLCEILMRLPLDTMSNEEMAKKITDIDNQA
jgi:protein-tyrosine-phosphatase